MARSSSAVMLLGLLVVATLCVAEASILNVELGRKQLSAGVSVKVTVHNNAKRDVRMLLGVAKAKVVDVKEGAVAVLGPVRVKVATLDILKVEVLLFSGKGQVLKAKASADLDLSLVKRLVQGVKEVVFTLVEDVKAEVVQLLHGDLVVANLKLRL